MPHIQCMLGATEQTVAGHTYAFERDRFGRFVATVHNLDHAAVFLSVQHYREVPADPRGETAAHATAGIVPPQDEPNPQDDNDGDDVVPDIIDIKGIGAAMKAKLAEIGIATVEQIAALTPEQVAAIDEQLKLRGAIERADWIGQAKTMLEQQGEPTPQDA